MRKKKKKIQGKTEEIKIMRRKIRKSRVRKFIIFIIGVIEVRTVEENNLSRKKKRIYMS